MSKIDWDALSTAAFEAMIVMMTTLLPCVILVTLIKFSIIAFVIWWLVIIGFVVVLTLIFYKYERAVEEDGP